MVSRPLEAPVGRRRTEPRRRRFYPCRNLGGKRGGDNQAVTPADFDEYCITAPTDSRLPGGGGNQFCGLYDVNPAKFGQVDNLMTQASRFGNPTRVFNGVDVTLNARFAEGAQFSGGLSLGRTVTDNCIVVDSPASTVILAPATNSAADQDARDGFCKVTPPWSAGTQVKFLVVYPLPWDIQTSAIYQTGPGIPITATQVIPNAAIAPSLGRNLAACGNRVPCTANSVIALIPDQNDVRAALPAAGPQAVADVPAGRHVPAARQPGPAQHLQRSRCAQHEHPVRRRLAEPHHDSRRTPAETQRTIRLLNMRYHRLFAV